MNNAHLHQIGMCSSSKFSYTHDFPMSATCWGGTFESLLRYQTKAHRPNGLVHAYILKQVSGCAVCPLTEKVPTWEHPMMSAQTSGGFERLRGWARSVKRDVYAVYFAARDRRTPWYARALAFVVAAYALSPIDLIPDFIPVIGYLDDIVLVPLGILLVVRMIPPEVMAEHRQRAAAMDGRPTSLGAAIAIIFLWICAAALTMWYFLWSD